MPPQLLSLTGGPSLCLDKPIVLFGRDLECDVRFDSRKISRRHCCLAQVGNALVIRDLGSTNGVRINGVRVLEGRLQTGDELTIANHRYQVRWDGTADRRADAASAPAVVHVPREGGMPFSDEEEPGPESSDIVEDDPLPSAPPAENNRPITMPDEYKIGPPGGHEGTAGAAGSGIRPS